VLFVVIAGVAVWVRARPEPLPVVDVKPVAVAMPTTTTTEPPPPPSTAPPPPRASRAAVPVAPRAPLPPAERPLTGPFWVAAAKGDIHVFRSPGGEHQETLPSVNEAMTTTVLLVKQRVDSEWIEAYMPTRPNEHTGFVRVAEVNLGTVDTQIKVELRYHRLTAWAGDQMVAQERVAIGKPSTPTPTGIYYLAMLFRTPNPGGAYGPFVFGLSAHSNVYEQFGGGDGMVGLHGTNQPSSIGRSASNGCIRLPNAAINRLAHSMPAGTPIVITG